MSVLKPCPFCGSDEIEDEFDTGYGVVPAWCARCGADGPERGSEPDVDWNTRAATDLTDDQVHLMVSTFIAAYRGGNGMEAMRSAFDAAFPIPPKEVG